MYKALDSFTTKDYDVRRGEILAEDFTTQDEIQEFLNIGYIVEFNGSLDITSNGTYDVTEYEQAVVNISGGGSGSNNNTFVDTSKIYDSGYGLGSLITSIDKIDTSNMEDMSGFFVGCKNLVDLPVLNVSKATNMYGMFQYCTNLSEQSLNNILIMCINATSYRGTKTLAQIGFNLSSMKAKYPAERIQALPSYQAFLDAGWTIGY